MRNINFAQWTKRLLTLVLFASLTIGSFAQNANRIASTKIVDALAQLPAQNEKVYNRLIEDIASTKDEGLSMLIEMLSREDESAVKAQYALTGLVAYASAPSFDADQRTSIINKLQSTLESAKDETIKGFLVRQLMVLGIPAVTVEQPLPLTAKAASKALKAANKLAAKSPTKANRAQSFAALRDYITAAGVQGAEKEILKAIKGEDREYRFAALNAISALGAKPLYTKIGALLSKLPTDAVKDLIGWFGAEKAAEAVQFITPFLTSSDFDLVKSAAWALTNTGERGSISDLAALLSCADENLVRLGEDCLKSFSGDVASSIAPMFNNLTNQGKAAVINVLAQRRSVGNKEIIMSSLDNKNPEVSKAAFSALKAVAQKEDLKKMYSLLEKVAPEQVKDVQDAVNEIVYPLPMAERFAALTARRDEAAAGKQDLYWPMIIASANVEQLLQICAAGNNPQAFDALIKELSSKKIPGAQRLLQLRRAMEVAANAEQKNAVLNAVAKTNTFLGIIYAGNFIEIPELQQSAAQAVRLLGTGNKEFNGPEVVALLKRAAEVIKGKDSDYEKTAIHQHLASMPQEEGFVSMFNGKDLTGWQGLIMNYKKKKGLDNPFARAKLTAKELAAAQKVANDQMKKSWKVEDGKIIFFGKGYDNLCTVKKYGDFEMYVDWFLYPEGPEADAGIYLRGAPQVQIWDTARVNVGAQVGSGGLYNNQVNQSKPLCVADNGLGQWNSFYIKMQGERVTVYLNGVLVTDNVILENYWDRSKPIFPIEQIELQAHGSKVAYRNLYIRELPQAQPIELSAEEKAEGFEMLFDGTTLHKFIGKKVNYVTEGGTIAVHPAEGGFEDLYTAKEYSDFIFRFEFKLTPGANNGVGIRAPGVGDAAYEGMEIQILDHYNPIYQPWLRDYQYHGSVYGIIPTQNRDALKPVGEWNSEEIYMKGNYIRVTLNGVVITEGDIAEATKNGTYDGKEHPGLLRKSGHVGFLGHDSALWFRNVRIKELK